MRKALLYNSFLKHCGYRENGYDGMVHMNSLIALAGEIIVG